MQKGRKKPPQKRDTILTNSHIDMLRLNVGHVLSKSAGFAWDMRLEGQYVEVRPDLRLVRLFADAQLTRTPPGILFEGEIDTARDMECVRCLSGYALHSKVLMSELYTYPSDSESEWTIDEDCILNIAPLLREMLLGEEPIKTLCSPDCQGLCQICGQDWNLDKCACVRESIDARLVVLQKLLKAD